MLEIETPLAKLIVTAEPTFIPSTWGVFAPIADGPVNVIDLLPEYKIEIETNGTIMPTEKQLRSVQFNCSPKLSNSGNQRAMRIRKPVIEALRGADTDFKFVVMANEDLDEIEEEYIKGCGIEPSQVILMPQGVSGEEVIKNAQKVAEYAKQKGYRLLSRLHVELWGARRRV